MKTKLFLFLSILGLSSSGRPDRTTPPVSYVDSEKGNDAADGTGETTAWQSLERVNRTDPIPGYTVLFKRGGLWRGQLIPHSGGDGKRIVYGAYGTGEKPI